ncbi:MAG: 4-hydroxybutyrate dehydrogenase [Spirochaetaceae bacterium]|jgi:4-hydroxybutyrate dehydrogenase|nr:4-hydroxybutyrate dehydrogenase [Spirochaetaceae bacterium]
MNELFIKPELQYFKTCKEFADEFKPGKDDLVLTNQYIWEPFFGKLGLECRTVFQENFGKGEPTDEMFAAIYEAAGKGFKRVFGIGGGTVIDIAKVLALKDASDLGALYDRPELVLRDKGLVLLPTTCGTGSEVTNISIFALLKKNTKKGLTGKALFADYACLVPELLQTIPDYVFATSSIDAMVHAIESSLSPKATGTTKLFGYKALDMLLRGFKVISEKGMEARKPLMGDFLMASTYAGIAFGNAGCAAVHALSYPLGAAYHVAHGESNYAMFFGVMHSYLEIKSDGAIAELNKYMAGIIGCPPEKLYDCLEKILNSLIPRKPLREYGMKEADIDIFSDSVIANQQRLLANNFVALDKDRIKKIYRDMY